MADIVNKDFGKVLFHARTMPTNVARVKPTLRPLKKIMPYSINFHMDLSEKTFGDIAARLRWHRALVGLDQKDYAAKAGLKRSQLSNWEAGNARISIDGAISLRKTYGLSLDFIYEGIDDALPMTLRAAWSDKPDVSASK